MNIKLYVFRKTLKNTSRPISIREQRVHLYLRTRMCTIWPVSIDTAAVALRYDHIQRPN